MLLLVLFFDGKVEGEEGVGGYGSDVVVTEDGVGLGVRRLGVREGVVGMLLACKLSGLRSPTAPCSSLNDDASGVVIEPAPMALSHALLS